MLLALDELRRLGGSESLSECRAQIDLVDDALLLLIAKRLELARAAGQHKKTAGKPLWDEDREGRVIDRLSSSLLIPTTLVERLWRALAKQWLKQQRD